MTQVIELNPEGVSIVESKSTDYKESDEKHPRVRFAENANEEEQPPKKKQKPLPCSKRRRLIMLCHQYKICFQDTKLRHYHWPDLEMLEEDELEGILSELQYMVKIGNVQGANTAISEAALGATESILCTFTPLRVEGLRDHLMSDSDFNDLINEYLLENNDLLPQSVEQRLFASVGRSIVLLHRTNVQMSQKTVSQQIMDEFNDL